MASASNESASPAASSTEVTAQSPSQRVVGMHSGSALYDAVEGLTSLDASRTPCNYSPIPNESNRVGANEKKAFDEANEVCQSSLISRTSHIGKGKSRVVKLALPPSRSIPTLMNHHPPPIWSPSVQFMPHPAMATIPSGLTATHSSPFKKPALTGTLPASFRNLHVAYTNFSADADMATDRNLAGQRIAAMSRAATASYSSSAPVGTFFPYYGYHYQDHNPMPLPPPASLMPPLSIPYNRKNFPETLLEVISLEAHNNIISWLPHGRGFVLLDRQQFSSVVLPHYFDGAKYTSFTRRLKRWGFVRVPRGPELGAYYNRNFVRDQPELVQEMRYQVDVQSEDGKKKNKEKDTPKNRSEDIKKRKVETNDSTNALAHTPPSLKSSDDCTKQQPHAPSAKISSQEKGNCRSIRPQDPLPENTEHYSHKNLVNAVPRAKNAKEVATFSKHTKYHANYTAKAMPSSLPWDYPNRATSNYLYRPREVEARREAFSQSMLSNEINGRGSRSGPASAPVVQSISNRSRAVLMSQEEEEEFARYLFLKRTKNKKGTRE